MTIITSPYAAIDLREISITNRVFEGLGDDPDRALLIDGPSGRVVTVGTPWLSAASRLPRR